MSIIHLSTAHFPLPSSALLSAITPVVADFCCYQVFKSTLSSPTAYWAASLGGISAFVIFYPPTEKSLLGTSLLYLGYKVAHYFLRQKGAPTSKPPSNTSSTITKSPAEQQPPPLKPPASQSKAAALTSNSASNAATPPLTPSAAQPAPKEPLREIPRPKEIAERFEALANKFTLTFEAPIHVEPSCHPHLIQQEIEKKEGFKRAELDHKMRERWKSQELLEESADLVKDAAAQMLILFYDLSVATQHIAKKEEQYKEMAHRLMTEERFSKRFYPSNLKTVLHIYRFVRGLRYILFCPSLVHNDLAKDKKLRFWTNLKDTDIQSFGIPNTPQHACREAYNKVVEVFAPLMPYLPEETRAWLVKDDQGQPFEIIPRKMSNRETSEKKEV
ncbi:MAG: hypothetical protein JSS10_00200 [Verrucomicrobia bacterium]|nr:hypothetical protein [Verrucomicrobiota bacterium]